MNLTILVFYPSGGGYNVIGATVFSWAVIEDI